MATIKSYTDFSQSKKLAEFLPLESADMCYPKDAFEYHYAKEPVCHYSGIGLAHPCWSLASLLEQLKSEIILESKQILFLHLNKYDDIDYEIRYTNSWTGEVLIAEADNLVDACYELILKLHELNLL